ncbi:hypothetical protein ACIP93_37525 [Streptomyces sp. NPDC088745]|uniref:hypothetical protein n=1 Tax=Streptomyces sp. NPDC088745 TaxID=3365884 RepID=UPI00382BDBA4
MDETQATTGTEPTSPLEQAHQAKRARDLTGELTALTRGHEQLETASWAPTRIGDRVVLTVGASGGRPGHTETYEVVSSSDRDPIWEETELRLVSHTAATDADAGWYAGPPEFGGGDAIETAWMEAGPDRLAIIRGGVVVHQGRHAETGLPPRDVDAIAAASKYVKHGLSPMGGSFLACICPKEPCGGVSQERKGCPEHDREPCQRWHWAAECPAR